MLFICMWTIYCHIHTKTGRRYVGLTKMTMMKRWNRHIYDANKFIAGNPANVSHFPNAIRKYGKSAFVHEILESCPTLELANLAEEKWISHFKTTDPRFGFNLSRGGGHIPHPMKNPWDRPEYRAKQIPRLIEMTHTPQALANSKAAHRTPEFIVRASLISREIHSRPEVKKALRDSWKDPERRRRMLPKPRSHCKHGHAYTLENTYYPKTKRQGKKCRACERLRRKCV